MQVGRPSPRHWWVPWEHEHPTNGYGLKPRKTPQSSQLRGGRGREPAPRPLVLEGKEPNPPHRGETDRSGSHPLRGDASPTPAAPRAMADQLLEEEAQHL